MNLFHNKPALSMLAAADQQIQIKLKSAEEKYQIDQNVFSVSSNSSQTELQQLIKNLLDISDSDIEFSFRVGEEILQNTLRKYCESCNFSGEAVLEIDYQEKRKAPDESEVVDLDDWLGGVAATDSQCFAGLYNGQLAVIGLDGSTRSYEVHNKPIKSIAFIKTYEEDKKKKDLLVTTSLDQNLCYVAVEDSDCSCLYSLRGHTETVTCCSVSPSKEQIASGSWDTHLKVWSTSLNEPCDSEQVSKRRKNTGPQSAVLRTPLLTLGGHSQAITGICWKDNSQLITSSSDMSLKIWDTQLMSCGKTITINSSLQCVDWSDRSQLIATGSSDKYVRLFDPRGQSGTIVHSTLQGHDLWVSCVTWSPDSDVELVSGSYDGRSLLWDIRSPKSYLAVIGTHEDKVLCCDWSHGKLLSGGSDSKLHITKM